MKALIAIDGSRESIHCRGHGGQSRLVAGITARDPDRRTDGRRSVRRAVRRIRGLRPDRRAPPSNEERARGDPGRGDGASRTRRPRRPCAESGRRACIDDRRGGRLDVRRPHHPRGPWSRRSRARVDRLRVVRGGRSCALPRAGGPGRGGAAGSSSAPMGRIRRCPPSPSSPSRGCSGSAEIRVIDAVDLQPAWWLGFAAESASDRLPRRTPRRLPRPASTPSPSRRRPVRSSRRPASRSAPASGKVARPRRSSTRRRAGTPTWWSSGPAATGSSRRCSWAARRGPCCSDRRRPC